MHYWLYLVRCRDGSLYTGIAKQPRLRVAQHNAGKGAKYTRARRPVTLLRTVRCGAVGDALRLERAVKALTRHEKERLCLGRNLYRFARTFAAGNIARP